MIIIVSGIPGAGKSTVSRLLAARWARSVRLEGDVVGEAPIVNGLVLPGGEPADEAERQLRLRRHNLCLLADSFADADFDVVIDDVVLWPVLLDDYRRMLRTRPLHLVVLAPGREVAAARDRARGKHVFEHWRHLDADLRAWRDQPGLRLDTSALDPAETVAVIERSWGGTLVDS